MKNITVLNNLPTSLAANIIEYYKERKGTELDFKWSSIHYGYHLPKELEKEIAKQLPFPILDAKIYVIKPRPGKMMIPHIDRGRHVAFQIPIDIDTENSFTFSLKDRDITQLTPRKDANFVFDNATKIEEREVWFWDYEESKFDRYNLEKPILQNAAMPHGGANNSNRDRVFISISFKENTYDEVVEAFKQQGWV